MEISIQALCLILCLPLTCWQALSRLHGATGRVKGTMDGIVARSFVELIAEEVPSADLETRYEFVVAMLKVIFDGRRETPGS